MTKPSLIRVFAVRMKKPWADAKADLSLRWAHTHFVGFVMSRLICNVFFIYTSETA